MSFCDGTAMDIEHRAPNNVIKVAVSGSSMDLHVFGAEHGDRVIAVVILMFPRSGMDGFPQRIAETLASNRCVVIIPDITHRISSAIPVRDRKRLLTDEGIIEDIGAALSYMDSTEFGLKPRFIIGHCMGGRNALLGASAFRFDGAASFYGGELFDAWGGAEPPFTRLHKIRCPILAFFGGKDKNPSPEHMALIDEELSRAGVEHRFFTYEDVGHAFLQNADRSLDERRAADDSSNKLISFFRELSERQLRYPDADLEDQLNNPKREMK